MDSIAKCSQIFEHTTQAPLLIICIPLFMIWWELRQIRIYVQTTGGLKGIFSPPLPSSHSSRMSKKVAVNIKQNKSGFAFSRIKSWAEKLRLANSGGVGEVRLDEERSDE